MNPFREFNRNMLPLLNALFHKVDGLANIRGDNFITIRRTGNFTTIGLNIDAVRRRIKKLTGGISSGGGDTAGRRAKVTQDAPAGSTITANLYNASTGIEATEGDDFGVTIYCNISNGTALNEATRRLEDGDNIFVTKSVYDNAGTAESRWYCIEGFMTTENCTCEEPA